MTDDNVKVESHKMDTSLLQDSERMHRPSNGSMSCEPFFHGVYLKDIF